MSIIESKLKILKSQKSAKFCIFALCIFLTEGVKLSTENGQGLLLSLLQNPYDPIFDETFLGNFQHCVLHVHVSFSFEYFRGENMTRVKKESKISLYILGSRTSVRKLASENLCSILCGGCIEYF